MSWADFHVRYKYILRGQRLLTLNDKAVHLLEQIPETGLPHVFLNAKTGAPYKLHEFYYSTQEDSETGKASMGGLS